MARDRTETEVIFDVAAAAAGFGGRGRKGDMLRMIGMSKQTYRNKLLHPETMTLGELRRIRRVTPIQDEQILNLINAE